MADILKTGSDFLHNMQHTHAAGDVVYTDLDGNEIQLKATIGKSEFEISDEQGFATKAEMVDFLVMAEDLVVDSVKITPAAGHKITIARNGTDVVFEVMNAPGQNCYKFSDSYGKRLRIHTKEVSQI